MSETKTREEITEGICDALASFGPDRDQVTLDATLADLDIDSLDLVELAQIVDEQYGVRLEAIDLKDVETVGQAIDVVIAKRERTLAGQA
ncbi:MAG TPA: phosphopantetheine-binding protein [Solirubrobacteraceae bacterium]|nr:phosphopantetheine-binding protein [Solirubrobacteraceae bacterium]